MPGHSLLPQRRVSGSARPTRSRDPRCGKADPISALSVAPPCRSHVTAAQRMKAGARSSQSCDMKKRAKELASTRWLREWLALPFAPASPHPCSLVLPSRLGARPSLDTRHPAPGTSAPPAPLLPRASSPLRQGRIRQGRECERLEEAAAAFNKEVE